MDVQKKRAYRTTRPKTRKAESKKANQNKAQMVCLRRPSQAQKETKN
jgi:hypothetical protein